MSIKQAIEALEELVEYAETAGFDWSLDNARAALAALRSMPAEPVATIRYERGTPGKENDMPKVVSCNWLPDGVYSVYATPHTEAVRMSEAWQPIETAPKDGRTLLLGYLNSLGNWRTVRGQWMSQDYIDEYWEDPEGVEAGWFETCVEADEPPNCWPIDPTHWLPLPPAPTKGTE